MMTNHLGEEVLFGPRVAPVAPRAAPELPPAVPADVETLRLRIQQTTSPGGTPRTRRIALLELAIGAPIGASVIGALWLSFT
jgi:hypothetical protein